MSERQSIVVEEYLQLIYQFQAEEGSAKAVQLATRMQTSASTVHATLTRMQRDGLIQIDEKKHIRLTSEGEARATDMVIRHNVAEYFLCNVLGIPWYEVHKHAHQLEHAMTPLVVEKLMAFLNFPESCPHGTPLPGHPMPSNWFALDQATAGMNVQILRIDESLEDSEELLRYLHDKQIVPGKQHAITERLEATHSLILESPQGQVTLPFDIAQKIRVIPSPKI